MYKAPLFIHRGRDCGDYFRHTSQKSPSETLMTSVLQDRKGIHQSFTVEYTKYSLWFLFRLAKKSLASHLALNK